MNNQSSDQRRQPENQAKKQSQPKEKSYSIARSRVQFFRRAVRVVDGTKQDK